ncbi:MAG: CoA-binding protein [Armatimonadota bacterium]|nr:CoA-binding protein [Armatimonadota bacterium]MDR7422015.1 CoA-binding protein [Armatimonadota bacterium]MDR7454152.1 CoA-binding protein [Armatimonadota bacterium]MDR7455715.1 CoA-binding protein [Armatimonadota bacterium]MDR7496960.1 CoA-binding protein [Armatimonadota bacterium]
MNREAIGAILSKSRTIAVVGLSDNPARPSHQVAGYLQRAGYRIIPVNPHVTRVHGETAVASLREVPGPVDVVLIFRRPEHVPAIVEDAIAIGARAVWMQSGIRHSAAAARARAAGLAVVEDACMMVEHRMRAGG